MIKIYIVTVPAKNADGITTGCAFQYRKNAERYQARFSNATLECVPLAESGFDASDFDTETDPL